MERNNDVFCFFPPFQISCSMYWPCTCVYTALIQPTTPGLSWLRLHKAKRQSEWLSFLSTSANGKSINMLIRSSYLPVSTFPHTFLPPHKHAIRAPLCPLSKCHHFLLPLTAHKEELKTEKGPCVVSIDTNNCCIWQITGHSTESKTTLSNSLYWEQLHHTSTIPARHLGSQLSN